MKKEKEKLYLIKSLNILIQLVLIFLQLQYHTHHQKYC